MSVISLLAGCDKLASSVEAIKMVEDEVNAEKMFSKIVLPRTVQRGHLITALAMAVEGLGYLQHQKERKEKAHAEEVSKLQSEKEKNEKVHTEEVNSLREEILKLQGEKEKDMEVHTELESLISKSVKATSQEEEEGSDENEKVHTGENSLPTAKVSKNLESSTNAGNVTKCLLNQVQRQNEVCKFYRTGYCRYKKNCRYGHPKICEAFESFGYKEGGCREKNC